jgi:hypothetical protein
MDIKSTFGKRLAPELNHLYTVPPFRGADGGSDCGWYCREHAVHTYVVAKLLGLDADIRRGDYLIRPKDQPTILSIGDEGDHAWCRIGNSLPVDLSMTFRYFGDGPQLGMPVCKLGANGAFDLRYTKSDAAALAAPEGVVYFVEREIITISAWDLVVDPYLFIYDPVLEDVHSWHNVFGPDIYAAISLHCFRVATGHAKTTRNRLSPFDSPRWIHETYPNPREELRRLLS